MEFMRGNNFSLDGDPDVDPAKVDQADLVIIQRDFPRFEREYQAVVERARRQAKPVIYEADDLLLELPEDHPDRSVHYYSRATYPMLRAILEADGVTTSTPALGSYFRRLNPNTWVLPNYLIDQLWSLEKASPPVKRNLSTVVIGYMGTISHVHDLEMIGPILQRLIDKYGSQVAFKFLGAAPPASLLGQVVNPSQVEVIPLKIMDYAEFAAFFTNQTCDIFVAPLTDSPFNRSKSPIKYLEYSALGIPGVYSDITPYQIPIQPGVNGFLAASLDDWDFHLRRLIESPELRSQIGQAALATVRKDWMLSAHSHEWPETYSRLIQTAQQEKPEVRQLKLAFSDITIYAQEWQRALEDQANNDQKAILELERQLQDKRRLLHEAEVISLSQDRGEMIGAYLQALRHGRPVENQAEVISLYKTIAKQVASRIKPSSPAQFRVLDLGCGAGYLVTALRQQGMEASGIEYPGVDLHDRAKADPQSTYDTFCKQAALTDPLPGKFDLILSLETLQYLTHEQIEGVVTNICNACDDALISCNPSDPDNEIPGIALRPELLAELFGQHGFFRDADFDAWFISPWAIRFRRQNEPVARLAANYERRLSPAIRENRELRSKLTAMRRIYDQEVEQLRAENVLIPALNHQIHDLSRQVDELSAQIVEWHHHWTSIQGGMAWRIVQAMIRIQPRLAPTGSRRYKVIQWLFETARKTARRLRGQSADIPEISAPQPAEPMLVTPVRQVAELFPVSEPLPVAYYSSDPWTAACAHLRVVGPSNSPQSGILILPGTNWDSNPVLEFPEQAQAVLIQRDFPRHEQLYQQVIAWARSTDRPVVYELDDLLTELPEEHPEINYYRGVRANMLEAMRSADAVILATLPLAEYARQYNPNTWVLPNYLDDRIWRRPNRMASPIRLRRWPVVIGYMGGLTKTHLPDLELVVPILVRMLRRYRGRVQLRFWGLLPPELEGFEGVEFRSERFPNYLEFASYFSTQSCDFFIAPLRDSQFNRCKSPIKYLEYSALGIPGIYSRIAPYSSLIVEGKNGLLAGDELEWEDQLSKLIENTALRLKIGKAAREATEKYYRMSQHAHEWGTIYRSALAAAGKNHFHLNRPKK
jgi:glycosyltransferase involved in cell wall biosynthesis/SAM-dependent methyltransferase